ncbi:MAG: CTQ-dependent lysine 6-oxidase LodA [Cyanobacteria bacterium P01_F01_bin.150]
MAISIYPSIGVARLGNSPDGIFLAPDKIGGLPYEYEELTLDGNLSTPVTNFKDVSGCIKRQGQLFRLFDDIGEITTDRADIVSIEWTVHLASKKAAWYQYNELAGNLLYPNNSYEDYAIRNDLSREDMYRNPGVEDADRQTLIIDPGPRTLSTPGQVIELENNTDGLPSGYPQQFPNADPDYGVGVTTLGTLRMDSHGRLIVLGGFGNSGGDLPITNYGGSDTWHDDIADGPVYCTVTYSGPRTEDLKAWVIVGSPDFAPEIVNISTLSDTMFDVGVRHLGLLNGTDSDDMYDGSAWNPNYRAHFERDILPIIQRIRGYQWVSNVQSMSAFFANNFDFTDNNETTTSEAYLNRQNYFSYFRQPNGEGQITNTQKELFQNDFPMMPLNSGSNSVSNDTIVKFLALNETQHFLLGQWAAGKFDSYPDYDPNDPTDANALVDPRHTAGVGNCVGLPMCPGIEVTWLVQNPAIYEAPYVIQHAQAKDGYNTTGLTPMRDECAGGGCEPGDLTKRMACPWQADFFQCTIQYVNFTDPTQNKVSTGTGTEYSNDGSSTESTPVNNIRMPDPPTYYSYWWPPQSPWDVLTGETTLHGDRPVAIDGQETPNTYVPSTDLNGGPVPKPPEAGQDPNTITVHDPVYLPAGQQVNYARGINSFVQMVEHWYALGFIRNQNPSDADYPYLVETERNHELFSYQEIPVGAITGHHYDNDTTIPVFSMEQDTGTVRAKSERAQRLVAYLEERAFKAIQMSPEAIRRHPRTGTRARR